jgi:hypothetical protein
MPSSGPPHKGGDQRVLREFLRNANAAVNAGIPAIRRVDSIFHTA